MNNYNLTLLQYAASRFLIINYNNQSDGVVIAVCGAGKTEMCFPLISTLIQTNKIAFAIPRIDICNDIYERLLNHYPSNLVGIHTGSKQINTGANLIVLTTNQILKYQNHFKLIIIDEVDAFPFDNDPLFYNGVLDCINNGSIFYLTSTPSARLLEMNLPTFTIYKRWHNLPLPVPNLIHIKTKLTITRRLKKLIANRSRNLLIFVSTITNGKTLSSKLTNLSIDHKLTYSTHPERNQILTNFKQSNNQILITTTILERGVTFDDIDVIVIDSDSEYYNQAALVQIAGRSRRKLDFQAGTVYFVYTRYTKTIKDSITFITNNNRQI